jgi:hypothetical protein
MLPTERQIRQAAHARWVQGGRLDGFALDNWIGAEQDLVLAMNYEEIALYFLDAEPKQHIGSKANRKCRYCGAVPPARRSVGARGNAADGRAALSDVVREVGGRPEFLYRVNDAVPTDGVAAGHAGRGREQPAVRRGRDEYAEVVGHHVHGHGPVLAPPRVGQS